MPETKQKIECASVVNYVYTFSERTTPGQITKPFMFNLEHQGYMIADLRRAKLRSDYYYSYIFT